MYLYRMACHFLDLAPEHFQRLRERLLGVLGSLTFALPFAGFATGFLLCQGLDLFF